MARRIEPAPLTGGVAGRNTGRVSEEPSSAPRPRPETEADVASRFSREAQALRANLLRRKQQQRARETAPEPEPPICR